MLKNERTSQEIRQKSKFVDSKPNQIFEDPSDLSKVKNVKSDKSDLHPNRF